MTRAVGLGPWAACPRWTQWGADMVEAIVEVTPDETAYVVAHASVVPLVADAIVRAARAPLDMQHCTALVAQHLGPNAPSADVLALIRAVEAAHGIGAPHITLETAE